MKKGLTFNGRSNINPVIDAREEITASLFTFRIVHPTKCTNIIWKTVLGGAVRKYLDDSDKVGSAVLRNSPLVSILHLNPEPAGLRPRIRQPYCALL